MKSPFPGMDPHLERHWEDVHHRLITYACDALQPLLPGDLYAAVEERLVVESGQMSRRRISPDVAVREPEFASGGAFESAGGGLAVAEPVVIEFEDLEVTEGFIEIHDQQDGDRLVTAIEFLSPTNKLPGDGKTKYLQKQREVIEARAALVEIDLVRAGRHVLAAPWKNVPEAMRGDYLACVTTAAAGTRRHELYPLALRRRLPVLPIPLRAGDPRIPLDLQALLDRAYEGGRYDRRLDYAAPLDLPLAAEEAAWAAALRSGR